LNYRNKFRDIANSIVGKLATVKVKKLIKTDCPNCTYDPINNESTNPQCQTCGGVGKVISEKKAVMPAFVSFYNTTEEVAEAGVVDPLRCKVSVDSRTSFVYREYLKPTYRIYIDDDIYEIDARATYGVDRGEIETFTCTRIIEPTAGVR